MNKTKKKAYEKPVVKRVNLDGRGSVLGFCKTNGTFGPASTHCMVVGSCNTLGS